MFLLSTFYFLFSRRAQARSVDRVVSPPGAEGTHAARFTAGQAALSFVFLVGSIVILVGVTLGFLTSSFVNSSFGYVAAQRALSLAKAGANDGYFQLLRNKDFSNTTGYSVPLGADSATVTVTQNVPSSGLVRIISTATVSFHTRKVQVIASVASSTGQVSLVLWKEIQ